MDRRPAGHPAARSAGPHPHLRLEVAPRASASELADMPPPRAALPRGDRRLRRAARFLCAEARVAGAHAEPLLAVLERKWMALPAAPWLPQPGRRAVAWGRLVALCREELDQPDARPAELHPARPRPVRAAAPGRR